MCDGTDGLVPSRSSLAPVPFSQHRVADVSRCAVLVIVSDLRCGTYNCAAQRGYRACQCNGAMCDGGRGAVPPRHRLALHNTARTAWLVHLRASLLFPWGGCLRVGRHVLLQDQGGPCAPGWLFGRACRSQFRRSGLFGLRH